MVDKILDFHKNYDEDHFYWTDSVLYEFLCNHYMISDVLIETNSGMVIIRKHNIVGYSEGNKYISIYESIGELDKVKYRLYLNTIHSVIALE